ncbi:MAG: cell division protein FtsL [Lachnospiraceae bacterium]|nr:cell division protein FtsL [Lachnospiraceae bacterium]
MAARSQGRQVNTARVSDTRRVSNTYYTEGTAARQLDVRRAIEEEPRRELSHGTRKNREKAHHMNFGYVLFLAVAMLVAGYVLIGYIQMQAELTSQYEQIASLESELNYLRLYNEDELARINSAVNLEDIKQVAIGELGMVYATEGQIVFYENEGSDYVRQVADIPK